MYQAVPPPTSSDDKDRSPDNKNTAGENDKTETDNPPTGVSEKAWKKFLELKKRREQTCKTSTDRRLKHLGKQATDTVLKDFQSAEEQSILREHGVCLPSSCKRNSRAKTEASSSQHRNDSDKKDESKHCYTNPRSSERTTHALVKDEVQKEINQAIKVGKFTEAERLSDQLQSQEYNEKVKMLLESREYAKRTKEQKERAKKSKKTKLHWGFEQKERWESKGNM